MQLTVPYLSTTAIFLVLDGIMLLLAMKPLFARHLGPALIDPIGALPALLFYAALVAGLAASSRGPP